MKWVAFAAMMLGVIPACGQGTPTLQSSTSLVVVPTLVQTPSGELIHALHATDFILTDNGVIQQVIAEEEDTAKQPLAVLVLLQTGASASRQFASYKNLGTMLEGMMGVSKHHVALVSFDSQPEEIWDFTPDIDDLKDGFTHPKPGDDGAAVLDAVNFGIDQLKQQPANYRRVLILVSQTRDSSSRIKMDEVVRRLGESNVTICSVAFSPEKTWLKDQFTKPRHENAPYAMPNHESLLHTFDLGTPLGMALKAMQTNAASEIALLSGGEYVQFGERKVLERDLGVMANHVPNRYLLSFRPTSNEPGFHALEVHIAGRANLQVAARTSYWAADR
jgi:VWFA-related protein